MSNHLTYIWWNRRTLICSLQLFFSWTETFVNSLCIYFKCKGKLLIGKILYSHFHKMYKKKLWPSLETVLCREEIPFYILQITKKTNYGYWYQIWSNNLWSNVSTGLYNAARQGYGYWTTMRRIHRHSERDNVRHVIPHIVRRVAPLDAQIAWVAWWHEPQGLNESSLVVNTAHHHFA